MNQQRSQESVERAALGRYGMPAYAKDGKVVCSTLTPAEENTIGALVKKAVGS